MVFRVIVTLALVALSVGFLWFVGTCMYLGVKEFFGINSVKKIKSKSEVK